MDGVAQKATEVTIASLPSSFDNIRWHRHRRANHLSTERRVIRSANASCNTVDVEGQSVRLSPNVELAELTHEFILMRRSEATTIIPPLPIPLQQSDATPM